MGGISTSSPDMQAPNGPQENGRDAAGLETTATQSPRADAGPTVGPLPSDGGSAPDPSDFVFDDKKLSHWSLTVAPADLKKLDDTALMELYVPATLTVDDEAVGRIGLRHKGAVGSLAICFVKGVNTCKKLPYKIDFTEYDEKKRFHGLKKINLHSQTLDPTLLHERLGYKLFRDQGIATSRSSHAKVSVNGVYKGVFGLTEEIDGRLTRRWWPNGGDGNLYKEAWPQSADPKFYIAHQKTNEPNPKEPTKIVVPPTKILDFQKALYAATATEAPKIVDAWMGLDYMLKIVAINNAITNWDSPLTFHCYPDCLNHNFFIYESPTEKRLWLIPWDLDVTFNLTDFREKYTLTPWDQPPANCAGFLTLGAPEFKIKHPGCDRLFRALAQAGRPRFVKAVNELLDGPFKPALMRADLDVWATQISEAVRTDPNGPDFTVWQANVKRLKQDLDLLREKLIALRDAKPWTAPKP